MTYHDLSPELQKKVKANTIAYRIKEGETKKQAIKYLKRNVDGDSTLLSFFIFKDSPEGKDYWWDVISGKMK